MPDRRKILGLSRRQMLSGSVASAAAAAASAWHGAPASAATSAGASAGGSVPPGGHASAIDRQAVVSRHNVVRTSAGQAYPVQVGNGGFAFGADITGLQTFAEFNTMSEWGWYSQQLPPGETPSDFTGTVLDTHGRPVSYPFTTSDSDATQQELYSWLRENPQRINLARIGLRLVTSDGWDATIDDVTAPSQELDLWTAVLDSQFAISGEQVRVTTCCHPDLDALAVRIESPLAADGRLSAFIDFPYVEENEGELSVGVWDQATAHQTSVRQVAPDTAVITHSLGGLDDTTYQVYVRWTQPAVLHVPEHRGLAIVSARYGAGSDWADVTPALRALVQNDTLDATVGTALAGTDPAPGLSKVLETVYTYGTDEYKIRVPDGGQLLIGWLAIQHRYALTASTGSQLDIVYSFWPQQPAVGPPPPGAPASTPQAAAVVAACQQRWPEFWQSGGAIDLSGSTDSRWQELERRVVLSEYLEAVNEAGYLPPQENGLLNRNWWGKFHMEMYWWHSAHWALWNRWQLLDRSLGIYQSFLPSSRERASGQGYLGARWPKMTDWRGAQSPGEINVLLIWEQPHPMLFAELDYRAHPAGETLRKWQDVLFAAADFMASYAFWDSPTQRYVLGPPMYPMSENTDPLVTVNPAFELSYWRTGLRIAQTWRQRLGLGRDPQWDDVLGKLAALPVQDGYYVTYEGISDMWTEYNSEHPGLVGVYGWLPGDGVDLETFGATAERVFAEWQNDSLFGWDYPMMAMAAARMGRPDLAVDTLLTADAGFQFDDAGLSTIPYAEPYFPSNGSLLYAIAMMCAGWDGAPGRNAPGFPDDGTWVVRWEGLARAL